MLTAREQVGRAPGQPIFAMVCEHYGLSLSPIVAGVADLWGVVDAVGSIGSTVLAGIAGVIAYRLFKVESERDRRAEEAKVRQQADMVGVWTDDADSHPGRRLVVANHSPLPICGLGAYVSWRPWGHRTARDDFWREYGDRRVDILAPGERKEYRFPEAERSPLEPDNDEAHISATGFRIVFLDNAGRYWARDSHGAAIQLDENPEWADSIGWPRSGRSADKAIRYR